MIAVKECKIDTGVRPFPAPVVDLRSIEMDADRAPADSVQRGLLQHAGLFACPRCGGTLEFSPRALACKWCTSEFPSDGGIPLLFFPHDVLYGPRDVTRRVQNFFDANPFPKYGEAESAETLRDEFSAKPLTRLLNERIPANSLILDAGCGTGRLAHFLGLQKDRQVIGGDLSLDSLRHAKRFKDRCGSQNTGFLQMNLFRPPFRAAVFDVVIADSVLHYTSDPLRGFRSLAALLKPDGLFVLSLYNTLGRVGNDARRLFHRVSRDRLAFLRLRKERQRGRFIQRYKRPWETRHSLGEVAEDWLAANQFEFLFSAPGIGSRALRGSEDLRYPRWPGDRSMRLRTEFGMLLRGLFNDGLFVMIGRNKTQPKRLESAAA